MSETKALAIIPRSITEVTDLAARFSKSALLPPDLRGKEADVFVTLLAGQELGLSPMASLRSIHVVKGKPILSADVMVGLVLASGLCEYFRPGKKTGNSVTYVTKRKGCEPVELEWTLEYARNAGLGGGDNWKKYPRAMLSARCKAELARDVYPDVLAGVYEESEAAEFREAAPVRPLRTVDTEAVDAEIVEEKKAPAPSKDHADAAESIDHAADVASLRQVGGVIAGMKLTPAERADLKVKYAAKMRALWPADAPASGAAPATDSPAPHAPSDEESEASIDAQAARDAQ
jgi:hypothetical protein